MLLSAGLLTDAWRHIYRCDLFSADVESGPCRLQGDFYLFHCRFVGAVMIKRKEAGQIAFQNVKRKGKGFPYSITNVGPGADPGAQAVSPQVTVSHPPGGRRAAITLCQACGYLPSY